MIAVIYTTPWDNHLVATGVWWYDPALVAGITLGWVPLEEYLFFVLQTVMAGLWFLWLARRLRPAPSFVAQKDFRFGSAAVISLVWMTSVALLIIGWKHGHYLLLTLAWALPPIVLQLALGADILWHHRRVILTTIVTVTLYLSGIDLLAIHSGIWTINPEGSLGILLGGVLPIEEVIFFLVTNTLLVFGLLLALAHESLDRLASQIAGRRISRNRQSTL